MKRLFYISSLIVIFLSLLFSSCSTHGGGGCPGSGGYSPGTTGHNIIITTNNIS